MTWRPEVEVDTIWRKLHRDQYGVGLDHSSAGGQQGKYLLSIRGSCTHVRRNITVRAIAVGKGTSRSQCRERAFKCTWVIAASTEVDDIICKIGY